jgi:hypothetical protein
MDFSPFDLFDSLLDHDPGGHAAGDNQDYASGTDHYNSDAPSFQEHTGTIISDTFAPHETGGGWHSPVTPLTEHAGHEVDVHEAHIGETDGDTGTHVVAHDLGGYEPNHTFHESRDLPNHSVDGSGPTTVPNGSAAETIGYHFHAGDDVGALAEQSRVLESILGRHVPEAQVAQAAYETGWYDVHRGTSLHDLDRAFESHGIAVERSFDTSLSNLHDALAGGDRVLVGLVDPQHYSLSGSGDESPMGQMEAGRTAVVIDIHQDDRGQWFVTTREGGAPDGHGQEIPLERFVESWDRCGRFALFTGSHSGTEREEGLGHHPRDSVGAIGDLTHNPNLDHHLGGLGQIEPGKIIGTPYHDVNAWHGQQHAPDTCAIRSQEFIIEQFTGHDIPEEILVQEAQSHGWYQPGQGTSPEHVGDLLELHGIPITRHDHASIEELVGELGQGHKVIIGVNCEELWRNDDPVLHGLKEIMGLNQADHAVVVSGIDTRDPAHTQVLITDPGNGQEITRYPLEQFLTAWKDSDFLIVATKTPVPSTAPEMAHFDYDKGHIDEVAGIPWREFIKRLAVPGALVALLGTTRKRQDASDKKNF